MNTGYKRANDMQGLYIYRNERLIQYGSWHSLIGKVDRNDEHYKLGKIFIDIPSDDIKLFGLNPTKTEVDLPSEFVNRLSEDMKIPRKWGNINKGKELEFEKAFDKRYRNDGNALAKRNLNAKKSKISTSNETAEKIVSNPKDRIKKYKKSLKPVKIIKKISSSESRVTIDLNTDDESVKINLIEFLKEWKIND